MRALTLLLVLPLLAVALAADGPTQPFETSVDIQPNGAEALKLQVEVKDLASDKVIAAPRLMFPRDDSVNSKTTVPGSGIEIRVTADCEGKAVSYSVEIWSADAKLLGRHSAHVEVE